jgi:hypothetical protein
VWNTTTTPTTPTPADTTPGPVYGKDIDITSVTFEGLNGGNCTSASANQNAWKVEFQFDPSIFDSSGNVPPPGGHPPDTFAVFGGEIAVPRATTVNSATVGTGQGASQINGTFQARVTDGDKTLNFMVEMFVPACGDGCDANCMLEKPVCSDLNEPGAILAYPLIDNIHGVTIVNIANTSADEQILECYMVTHGIEGTIDEKKDFLIYLSPKEKFVWMTNNPIDKSLKGNRTQIQGFDNRKGYMFCYTILDQYTQNEGCTIAGGNADGPECNVFKGDATLIDLGNARAFNYNAIPHQVAQRIVADDRALNLNGLEYTAAPTQIMFEGLAWPLRRSSK